MNKELWKNYLESVNYIETEVKVNKMKKEMLNNLDRILIFIMSLAIGIGSLWYIVQEIIMKLRL
jgi:hypothetical protein